MGYVQDERYIAGEHMDEVRPHSGREGGLGHVRRDCVSLAWLGPVRNELRTLQGALPDL